MWTSDTVQAPGCTAGPGLQELIFTARRVGGSEARQLGLVDHCVDAGGAMDRALELARDISQVSWWAYGVQAELCCGDCRERGGWQHPNQHSLAQSWQPDSLKCCAARQHKGTVGVR